MSLKEAMTNGAALTADAVERTFRLFALGRKIEGFSRGYEVV